MRSRTALPLLWLASSLGLIVAAPAPPAQDEVQTNTLDHDGRAGEITFDKRGLLESVGIKKPSFEGKQNGLDDMLNNIDARNKKLKSKHLERLTKSELYLYGGEHLYRLDLDESAKLARHIREYCLEEAKVRSKAMDNRNQFLQENRLNDQRFHIVPGHPEKARYDLNNAANSATALRLDATSRRAQINIERMSALSFDLRNHIQSLREATIRPKTNAKIIQDLDTIDTLVTRHDLFNPKKEAKQRKAELQAKEKAERKQTEKEEREQKEKEKAEAKAIKNQGAAQVNYRPSFFGWPVKGKVGKLVGFHTFTHEKEPSVGGTGGSRSSNDNNNGNMNDDPAEGIAKSSGVTSPEKYQPWSGSHTFERGESSQSSGSEGSRPSFGSSSSDSSRGDKGKEPMQSEEGENIPFSDEKEEGIYKDRSRKQGVEFDEPRD